MTSSSDKVTAPECNLNLSMACSPHIQAETDNSSSELASPAPSGQKIPLYRVAHSRAGDKGNDLNFSLIPH